MLPPLGTNGLPATPTLTIILTSGPLALFGVIHQEKLAALGPS